MMRDEVAAGLVGIYVVWMLVSMARSARRNLIIGRARERSRKVAEVVRGAQDPESCRRLAESQTRRLARRPKDRDAFMVRGLCRQVLGEFDGAVEDLSEALLISPDDYLFLCRGSIEIHRGNIEPGIADLDRALEFQPEAFNALLLRGLTQFRRGNREEAARDLDASLTMPVSGFDGLSQRAELRLHLRNDFLGAEADASAALRVRPDDVSMLLYRGFARSAAKRTAAANEDFERISRREAQTWNDHWWRSQARLQLKKFEAALEDVDAMHNQSPSSDEVRRIRVRIQHEIGDWGAARRDLDDIIGAGAATAWDYMMRGSFHADDGQYVQAIADYEQALSIQPDDGWTCNSLAWLLATCPADGIRDGARALRLAQRACDLLPQESDYPKGTLAAAFAECGDFAKAIEWEEKASQVCPQEDREEWAFLIGLYRSGQPYRSVPHSGRDRILAKRKRSDPVG